MLERRHIFANLTVNQKHFKKNFELLKKWEVEGLIHGLGVSLTDADDPNLASIKSFRNGIIHTVVGVLDEIQDPYSRIQAKGKRKRVF